MLPADSGELANNNVEKDMDSNSVQEFERRCEEKRKKGLVDLKFYAVNTSELTPEAFCEQANAIDDALARGDVEAFSFDDASR
jgi:hypothetical protein